MSGRGPARDSDQNYGWRSLCTGRDERERTEPQTVQWLVVSDRLIVGSDMLVSCTKALNHSVGQAVKSPHVLQKLLRYVH